MTLRLTPELQDIIDAQPDPGARRRSSWLRENWLAFAMFVAWALGQAASAGGWVGTRQAHEVDLATEIGKLRTDLNDASKTYVRQDVFDQVLRRIDDNLRSLNDQKQQRRIGGNQ